MKIYAQMEDHLNNLLFVTLIFSILLMCIDVLFTLFLQKRNRCNIPMLIIYIIFIILIVFNYTNLYEYIQQYNPSMCMLSMLILVILVQVININYGKQQNVDNISSMQGLDCGTYMAYSYYYGYLKLVLPVTGSLTKGLVEKLENIEDKHNIRIAAHKLFILIPQSSYIPPDLKEASYQWMESAFGLEDEIRDRAGVKQRSYHNCLYKIYPNGKRSSSLPVYVAVEGASPLLTFFETQKHFHSETNIYKKYHKDIIRRFYDKLNELINEDPECADLCELIYYNDYDNGIKANVAQTILNRLGITSIH